MGKDWPDGYTVFRDRCKRVFLKNKDLQDENKIKECLVKGEYVLKEIEALYKLKKYRTLKKRYDSSEWINSTEMISFWQA